MPSGPLKCCQVGPGSGVPAAGDVAHEGEIKQPHEKTTVAPGQDLLIVAAHQGLVLLQIHAGIIPPRSRADNNAARPGNISWQEQAAARPGQLTPPRAPRPSGTISSRCAGPDCTGDQLLSLYIHIMAARGNAAHACRPCVVVSAETYCRAAAGAHQLW